MSKKILFLFMALLLSSCKLLEGEAPAETDLGLRLQNLGKHRGYALQPCPPQPNCVASFEALNEPKNFLKPISYSEPREVAFNKLLSILLKNKSFKLAVQRDNYLYGELRSSLGLVSDVEFDLRENNVIHFRALQRVVPFDFGRNKSFIEEVRFKYHQNDI